MKLLAIDTSTKFFCLGLYDGGRVCEYNLEVGRKLSSLIAVTVKRALVSLGWQAGDIDFLACGLGPGSFTGMRTGISFVKGMSWALKKPLVGISTLDILAQGAGVTADRIVPIIDAKRSLTYCSVFKNTGAALKRLKPYLLLDEAQVLEIIKPGSVILGDALELYRKDISINIKGARILDRDYWYPRAQGIIELALAKIKAGKRDDPFAIKPIYLYPKECQIKKYAIL